MFRGMQRVATDNQLAVRCKRHYVFPQMRSHGGLPPLVQLLQSPDSDVRKNASWALLASAADPPSAAAISKLG